MSWINFEINLEYTDFKFNFLLWIPNSSNTPNTLRGAGVFSHPVICVLCTLCRRNAEAIRIMKIKNKTIFKFIRPAPLEVSNYDVPEKYCKKILNIIIR